MTQDDKPEMPDRVALDPDYRGYDGQVIGFPLPDDALAGWPEYLARDGATVRALVEALRPFAQSADGRRRKDVLGAMCFKQDVLLTARAALRMVEGEG